MKRLFNILGSSLGVLVLAVLAVTLYFALNGAKQPKITPDTAQTSFSPIHTPPVIATATRNPGAFQAPVPIPIVSILPTPTGQVIQPPPCQFEGTTVQTSSLPSTLDKFVFSEPTVVFSREAPIEIIEWLPDNRRLLTHIRNQTQQSIEVLDTTTGQTEVFADNLQSARQVHWVAAENAVVYTDDKTPEFSGIEQSAIWLSQGKGTPTQLLEAENAELLRIEENTQKLSPAIARVLGLYDFPFDPERWRYEKYPEDPSFLQSWRDIKFASLLSPDGSKAVFYGVPWLYMVDLKTNQPCEVDLGQYFRAYMAKWSLDGKLLAMLVADGSRWEDMRFSKLVILNTITGELYRPETKWSHVWDIQWFPDSRYLVVMGFSDEIDQPQLNEQIGIVDSLTQQFRLMLPRHVFAQGSQTGFQLALSPDGKSLTVNCPIVSNKYQLGLKGQVCLVSIK